MKLGTQTFLNLESFFLPWSLISTALSSPHARGIRLEFGTGTHAQKHVGWSAACRYFSQKFHTLFPAHVLFKRLLNEVPHFFTKGFH